MKMDTSLAENVNQLQKLVFGQESPNPSQRSRQEQSTQSRCFSDHQQHNPKPLDTFNLQGNPDVLPHYQQATAVHYLILDNENDIQGPPHQQNLIDHSQNYPTSFQPLDKQNDIEAFQPQDLTQGDGCFEKVSDKHVNLIQIEINQHDRNLVHPLAQKKQGLDVEEGCLDVEEDADPCLSFSDETEQQLPESERQSNALQRRPMLSEPTNSECQSSESERRTSSSGRQSTDSTEQPTSSEHQPLIPQRQPTSPEDQPLIPQRQPTSPEDQPLIPQRQPTSPEDQPLIPQRQPTSPEHQPLIPQRQPTSPEDQPSSPERQATENTDAESLGGNFGVSRLAVEHVEPSEDEDEKYRRMMSEELGKQWRDEPEACETTWSLESSLIESGYSDGRSFRSCRKCDLAEDMFLCPESRVFWKKVKGNTCCKRIWKDFFDELKREFPEESALSKKRVLKMFRCLLGVQYQELNEVTIENYLKFIGFFGPFRQEENRCVAVRQLEYLVENSSQQSKNKRSKLCWFAGYMSRQEAEGKLAGQEAGTFLVRMSGSGGMEGSFVVSLVMQDKQPEHFQIKGDPEEAVSTHPFSQELEFKGQQFSSLPDLVNNCLRVTTVFDTEDPSNGVRCKTICPNLPFNHILDGYKIA